MDRNFLQQWLTYSFSLIHSHTKHVPWSSVPEGMWADCAFAQSTAENKMPLTKTYCSLNWMSEFCTMILIKYRPNLYFFLSGFISEIMMEVWGTPFNGQNICFSHILFKGYIQMYKKLANCILVWRAHEWFTCNKYICSVILRCQVKEYLKLLMDYQM